MNIFSIIYILNLFLIIKADYEKISLKYEDNSLYIPIKIGNKKEENIRFSTMLPINFFPSSSCQKCKNYYIEEKDLHEYTLVQSGVCLLYYYLNYTGDIYRTTITLGSKTNSEDFIALNNINDIESYKGYGRYSLSFLNYGFNTANKIFGLFLNDDYPELHLGGYERSIVANQTSLLTFNISKTNNSLINFFNDFWYINFVSLYINGRQIEGPNFKLSFDSSTSFFHIPKDYFFTYASSIFPVQSRCQVQPEGIFVCFCNSEYKRIFSTFKFKAENNQTIEIRPQDYIYFDGSHGDNYCYVNIMLNYDSDYFIAGKSVMSNYYNIFDIDAGQLKLFPVKKKVNEFYKEKNFIISIVLLLAGIFLFVSCYLIYRKYFSHRNNQNNGNENIIDEEHLYYENINWDEINANNEAQNNNENNAENENNENNNENENNNNKNNEENKDKSENENDNKNNIDNNEENKNEDNIENNNNDENHNNDKEKIEDKIINDYNEKLIDDKSEEKEKDEHIINDDISNVDDNLNENENNDIIFGGRASNIIN